jgi:hypothetical protein
MDLFLDGWTGRSSERKNMLDLKSFFNVLKKPTPHPQISSSKDFLYDEGLTLGSLYIGRAGTGKTSSLADHIFYYLKRHPQEAIFVLDWSGSITDCLFKLILQDKDFENILRRVVYDDMGNPDWVIPFPEFSLAYGSYEEQVQRVSVNLQRLEPNLTERTPVIGGLSLENVATNFFRLATAITDDLGDPWQITEVKRLIYDKPLLARALEKFGYKEPSAKAWLEHSFVKRTEQDKTLSTMALISTLGAIEPNPIKARIGYHRPGLIFGEAIDKGLVVICDGARLIRQPRAQYYLFMQLYSLIMQEINKRRPADPDDFPVTLVLDEVYSLLRIPGMADEIASLSPQYRSRKLQLYIVLQELAQMSKELQPHIWSLGNLVCFGINNHDEAYEIAQQLFQYDRYAVKVAPITERQNPIMEPDRGQYLEYADWIQSLSFRQCIMRRFVSEHEREPKVQFVDRTYEFPNKKLFLGIGEAKVYLTKEWGVRVHDALKDINERDIKTDRIVRPSI